MYYEKFINFLKKHNLYDEEVIQYWTKNKISFDYLEEESRCLIGCYYKIENKILTKISLIVPFIDNDKTVLINIHEYIHLLLTYHKLGYKYKLDPSREILPIFYERIFIRENETASLLNYYNYLNSYIIEENLNEYVLALKISDILLKTYNNDNVFKLENKAKKLVRKNKKCWVFIMIEKNLQHIIR